MRGIIGMVALAWVFAGICLGQTPQGPTAETVKKQIEEFKVERAKAAKTFSPAELEAADQMLAEAEQRLAAGNVEKALQNVIEARWLVPLLPPNLPENVSRVLGVGRLRHGNTVWSLSYSPDGRFLASGSLDGTVRVWNLENGREAQVYRGHENEPYSDPSNKTDKEQNNARRVPKVAFAPDGKRVASCGGKEVHVWDIATGKLEVALKEHKKDASAVAFSATDPNLLATGGDDKRVYLWDLKQGKPIFSPDELGSNINDLTFSQDDAYLALTEQSGSLVMYSLKGEKKLALNITTTQSSAKSVALLQKGSGALVASEDSKIRLISGPGGYDKNPEGATVATFEGHSSGVNGVVATSDGKLMITVSGDKTVAVWDLASRRQIRVFQGHRSDVTSIALRPDGRQVATGDQDGVIKIWSVSANDEHRTLTEASQSLWTTAFSPNGKTFATGGADKIVRLYDSTTCKVIKLLEGHKSAVTALTYLTDETLITAAGDKLLKIWDIPSGKATDCQGHTSAVLAVTVQEQLIVSGSADKSVRGWDATGKNLWTWTGKSAVCAVSVQKGKKLVAVGTADGTLTILKIDGTTASPVSSQSAHQAGLLGLAFHPQGDRLATAGGDGVTRIWKITDAGVLTELSRFDPPLKTANATPLPIVTVSFSGDGRYLVCGGAEAVARIWDITTSTEVRGLRGATDWVTAAAFAPDGRSVLTVGVDNNARLFELPRDETSVSSSHSKPAKCVAVSRDGKYIATGSEDMTIKIWDANSGREVLTIAVPSQDSSANQNQLNAIAFVGTETIVVCQKENRLNWFDIKTGKEVKSSASSPGFALAVPEDGSRVSLVWAKAEGADAGFEIYPKTGESYSVRANMPINSAALSPDGLWGFVGGQDGILRIWDLEKRERVKGDWPLFKQRIADVGVSSDRKTLFAIDSTGTVKIGNTDSREITTTIEKTVTGEVYGLMVSPTNNAFCVLSATGELKTYDLKGKEIRSWKLPYAPNAAVFTMNGKKIITANADGTGFVIDMP